MQLYGAESAWIEYRQVDCLYNKNDFYSEPVCFNETGDLEEEQVSWGGSSRARLKSPCRNNHLHALFYPTRLNHYAFTDCKEIKKPNTSLQITSKFPCHLENK